MTTHSKIPYREMASNLLNEGVAKFQMLNFPRFKIFKMNKILGLVLNRYGCCNILPQTQWYYRTTDRNLLSLSSGGWKSEIKALAGLFPLRAVREGSVQTSLLGLKMTVFMFTCCSLLCPNALFS